MADDIADKPKWYNPICRRGDIAAYFYFCNKPESSFNKNFPKNPKKQDAFEVMDLGTYCKMNGITGDMLVQVDGETLKILIELSEHMQEKICSKTAGVAPELLEKFRAFIEFEQIKATMEKNKK